MSCIVFFSLFFFHSLSDFVDITVLFFGGTEMLEHTQTKVIQQPHCGNGHTLTTLQVPWNQMQNAKQQLNLMYKCLENTKLNMKWL